MTTATAPHVSSVTVRECGWLRPSCSCGARGPLVETDRQVVEWHRSHREWTERAA